MDGKTVRRIDAEIKNIEYNPQMCKEGLNTYPSESIKTGEAFEDSSFLIEHEDNRYAFSQWVSPKRSRSYPRARVYDTYQYKNRVTVIPLVKDEGKDGDRDYLQWDTLSLMSLLQIYVIIGYYDSAEKNKDYDDKITNQEFDYQYISEKFEELSNYQSDALHWNLHQASHLDEVANKAEEAYYEKISEKTGVEMKSRSMFKKRMNNISQEADKFKEVSRNLAEEAQNREAVTVQPKERTQDDHDKATITIENYLGGEYYFTVDEAVVDEDENEVYLIEKKHTRRVFPSLSDIKNGIVLMILFTNLDEVRIDGQEYEPKCVLGVTGDEFEGCCSNSPNIVDDVGDISTRQKNKIKKVFKEGNENGFSVYVVEADDEQKESELIESI
jgi:hypothetical protein